MRILLEEESEKGGATFVAQTKVTDSNLERFAAENQVCSCLNAQMSGFMLSHCLNSLSRRHKSLQSAPIYKSISLGLAFQMQLRKSNSFLVHDLHLGLPFNVQSSGKTSKH